MLLKNSPSWLKKKNNKTCAYLRHVGDEEGEPGHEEHAQQDAQRQTRLQRLLAVLAGEPPALAAGRGLAGGTGNLQRDTGGERLLLPRLELLALAPASCPREVAFGAAKTCKKTEKKGYYFPCYWGRRMAHATVPES